MQVGEQQKPNHHHTPVRVFSSKTPCWRVNLTIGKVEKNDSSVPKKSHTVIDDDAIRVIDIPCIWPNYLAEYGHKDARHAYTLWSRGDSKVFG